MKPVFGARKVGTGFIGLVADGDDVIKRLIQKSIQSFTFLGGDINANVGHDLFC